MRNFAAFGIRFGMAGVLCSMLPLPDLLAEEQSASVEIFNQRILPIFRSPKPSSCVQCHLSSVDLKNYILPSHEATFVSLRDQGLINVREPRKSKILELIRMGQRDPDRGAALIHEELRKAELMAFSEWIESCCRNERLCNLPALPASQRAVPRVADAVIRHGRKSRLLDSFERNIWSQRMRCFPCHTPHEVDPLNPRHKAAIKTRSELAKRYDERTLERLDLFKATPRETLNYLLKEGMQSGPDRLPLINTDAPTDSLLVLKPLSRLPAKRDDGSFEAPSFRQPVTHMGGLKMHPDDHSYKAFLGWIEDFRNVQSDTYATVDDLPADNWSGTDFMLRLSQVPDDWPVGSVVQMFLFTADSQSQPSGQPIAFTQGTVTPRRFVNGALFRFIYRSSQLESGGTEPIDPLIRGDYTVRVHLDRSDQVRKSPSLLLGPKDCVGQIVLKRVRWRPGFKQAEVIPAGKLSPVTD